MSIESFKPARCRLLSDTRPDTWPHREDPPHHDAYASSRDDNQHCPASRSLATGLATA